MFTNTILIKTKWFKLGLTVEIFKQKTKRVLEYLLQNFVIHDESLVSNISNIFLVNK